MVKSYSLSYETFYATCICDSKVTQNYSGIETDRSVMRAHSYYIDSSFFQIIVTT